MTTLVMPELPEPAKILHTRFLSYGVYSAEQMREFYHLGVEAGRKGRGWISASERQPEDGQTVVAILHAWNIPEHGRIARLAKREGDVLICQEGDDDSFLYPHTHWIPSPPTQEDKP